MTLTSLAPADVVIKRRPRRSKWRSVDSRDASSTRRGARRPPLRHTDVRGEFEVTAGTVEPG